MACLGVRFAQQGPCPVPGGAGMLASMAGAGCVRKGHGRTDVRQPRGSRGNVLPAGPSARLVVAST